MRFLLFPLLLFSGILSAQYGKGTLYFGQESGIDFLGVTPGLFGGFGVRARGGFFVRDRLLVGAGFEVGDFNSYESRNQFLVTPFARYYVPFRRARDLHLFGETGLTTNLDEQAALSPSFALGAEYQLAPGAMLTGSLRHTVGTQREPTLTTLGIGLNVLFGEQHSLDPALGYTNQKGDILLNPSIGNATFANRGSIDYSFAVVRLDGGIFLSDHIALMGSAAYSTSSANIGNGVIERIISSNETVLEAGLRYQFNNGRQWQPYAQGGVRYFRERRLDDAITTGVLPNDITYTHVSFDLSTGIMYHLSTVVALDASLNWRPIISSDYFFGTPGDQVGGNLRVIIFPFRSKE